MPSLVTLLCLSLHTHRWVLQMHRKRGERERGREKGKEKKEENERRREREKVDQEKKVIG